MFLLKLEKPTNQNSVSIELSRGKFAIVNRPVPVGVLDHHWIAVKWNFRWYAYSYKKTDGSACRLSMHRLIANTPLNEITHHCNGNSLDNRIGNLLNCSNWLHMQIHGIRKYGRKKK